MKKNFFRLSQQSFKKRGFTLVEILVIVVIIGVLASLSFITLNSVRGKARDAKRISDIRQIQSILEMYRNNNDTYPSILTPGASLVGPNGQTYISRIPNALSVPDGDCVSDDYIYTSSDPANTYTITYCLGGAVQSAGPGDCTAVPGQICAIGRGNFVCGDTVAYNGAVYNTAFVDANNNGIVDTGECWFKENLRTDKKPDGVTSLVHDRFGDYVFPGISTGANAEETNMAYVNQLGYLYHWNTAMNGSTASGAQGLCPGGWHIPTNAEFFAVEEKYWQLAGSSGTCSATAFGQNCANAGSALKAVGTNGTSRIPFSSLNSDANDLSGLSFLGAGQYDPMTPAWSGRGTSMRIWTSELTGGAPTYHSVSYMFNYAYRYPGGDEWMFYGVRCVND